MARIYLIDDDDLVRETLRLALESAAHDVYAVSNGSNIAEDMARLRPEFVVTDILMPQTDGLETIRRIRKTDANTKLIAISGGGRTRNLDFLAHAKAFGANATLAKPFLPRVLVELVARLEADA